MRPARTILIMQLSNSRGIFSLCYHLTECLLYQIFIFNKTQILFRCGTHLCFQLLRMVLCNKLIHIFIKMSIKPQDRTYAHCGK